ncbi:MAG: DsbA family protein [Pseudomonadota bacterium]
MVYTRLVLAAVMSLGATVPANALDLGTMTDAERAAFRAEVRAYLLDNPEVIMEAVRVLEQREADSQAQADLALVEDNAQALFEDPNSWVGGNPEGDVTLVEFLDYRCGFCRRAAPEIEDLLARDENIRIIVKEFPILGEQSTRSSRFAIATLQIAGDAAYKAVHDALIAFGGDVTEASLRRLGDSLDLPTEDVLAHMESDEVSAVIESNIALGQALRINGTPTFVMGDQMLRGFVPAADMQRLADAQRAR